MMTGEKRFQHRGHRGHGGRRDGLSHHEGLLSRGDGLCRFSLAAIPVLLVTSFLFPTVCNAQENPVFKIDEDISRFAYSGNGRIAYATRHVYSVKKIQLQRDDIWMAEPDGKKRRILLGEKFVRGTGPFSYTVRGLRWSPDGSKLTVEMGTSEMINDDGDTREGVMTLLLDDAGREIIIPGADSVIPGNREGAGRNPGKVTVNSGGEQTFYDEPSEAFFGRNELAVSGALFFRGGVECEARRWCGDRA